MGVRHLDTFIRENVPGGCVRINIEDEIRKYFCTAKTTNPPAPIIVVDFLSLFTPLGQHDPRGLFFGGRFNLAYAVIDEFFAKLRNLGAKLDFFEDGPAQDSKNEVWRQRQDDRYAEKLEMIDAVDRGTSVDALMIQCRAPTNFRYPVKYAAKKYGSFRLAMSRECDQELAAYATEVNAIAIIADDSDYLVYEGPWRYWSSRELDLSTLFTVEYNRKALVQHLGLNFKQMPLLATLSGNDVMPYEIVRTFHGQLKDKFPNIARYIRDIREKPLTETVIKSILRRVLKDEIVDNGLVQRFQLSLDTYSVNIRLQDLNPTDDRVLEVLLLQDSSFMYQIWQGVTLDISISVVDMRRKDFGQDYARLHSALIRRMAAIILFHRKPQRPTHCKIVIKADHQSPHQEHSLPIRYPRCMDVPSLPVMMSKEPVMVNHLRKAKLQLLSWIASDTLSPDHLQQVPQKLRITVLTVFYLLERQAIELFEADLFLQVAYDVAFDAYDFRAVVYPAKISSRPFRLVFLYQKIYALMAKAVCLVSLQDDNFREDPPFDGVLFHRCYEKWSHGQGGLDHIKKWRIYADVAKCTRFPQKKK